MIALATFFLDRAGMFSGVIAAWRRGTSLDKASLLHSLAFYSMPTAVAGPRDRLLLGLAAGGFRQSVHPAARLRHPRQSRHAGVLKGPAGAHDPAALTLGLGALSASTR